MNDAPDQLMVTLFPQGQLDSSLLSVLYRLFCRAGADPQVVAAALSQYGFPRDVETPGALGADVVPRSEASQAEAGKRTLTEAALRTAIVCGIRLAQRDDDYTHDEALRDEAPGEPEAPMYARILTERDQDAYELLCAFWRVAADLRQEAREEQEQRALEQIGALIQTQLEVLESRTMTVPLTEADWKCPDDRRRYYFKLGVLRSLQRQQVLDPALFGSGVLRRTRGYNVERVFRRVMTELPLLQTYAEMEVSRLLNLSVDELRQLVHEGMAQVQLSASPR